MNDLTGAITKADTPTLWALISDISEVMERRGYRMEQSDKAFMILYQLYRELESEINRRIITEFMEG